MKHEVVSQPPQFGEPNQAQLGHIQEGLYVGHLTGLGEMYEHPVSRNLFHGAEFALALHGTTEEAGAEGVIRKVSLPVAPVEVGRLGKTVKVPLETDIRQGFLFAQGQNGSPSKVKRTEITLTTPGGSIPLTGEGADLVNQNANWAKIILLDGKVSTVAWQTPEESTEGFSSSQMNPKHKPAPRFQQVDVPALTNRRIENNGEVPDADLGIDLRVQNILNAAERIFDTAQEGNEEEKARRIQAAEDMAAVLANTRASNTWVTEAPVVEQTDLTPNPLQDSAELTPVGERKIPI